MRIDAEFEGRNPSITTQKAERNVTGNPSEMQLVLAERAVLRQASKLFTRGEPGDGVTKNAVMSSIIGAPARW